LCSSLIVRAPHHAARAICLQSRGTTTQTRQTTFGVVCISLVRFGAVRLPFFTKNKNKLIGFTPRLLLASEDITLPEKYNLGLVRQI
jgi:hypothetical protein